MRVTVIIPTFRDWDRLQLCVQALKNQSYPQDLYDVVIVNNDPGGEKTQIDLPDNFKLIDESKPGSYAARNAGLRIAKGDIVAFTDSDCIPDNKWIELAVARIKNGAERIAGHVDMFFTREKLTFAGAYEKAFAFNQAKNAENGASVTANMITLRSIFNTVGMFDDAFLSGGDIEWGQRANNKGVPIMYAREVIVKHPAREALSDLLRKRRRVAAGLDHKKKVDIKYILTRGFLPPIGIFPYLRKINNMTRIEKLKAFFVAWLVKAYSSVIQFSRFFGYGKQVRI
jgi:GT2 family glycosyltransferase